jgi:hypothetical protein
MGLKDICRTRATYWLTKIRQSSLDHRFFLFRQKPVSFHWLFFVYFSEHRKRLSWGWGTDSSIGMNMFPWLSYLSRRKHSQLQAGYVLMDSVNSSDGREIVRMCPLPPVCSETQRSWPLTFLGSAVHMEGCGSLPIWEWGCKGNQGKCPVWWCTNFPEVSCPFEKILHSDLVPWLPNQEKILSITFNINMLASVPYWQGS